MALSKRLLFPTTDALPPLLATKVQSELTEELYDFIALALRAFVNPWWTKITRYDKEFLPEITRILTLVVRALETRILAVDIAPLLFRDIPTIVTQHYSDYRNAEGKLGTSYAAGGALSLPQLFHQLQPHVALSADGTVNPDYIRQILDHILRSCLPPDDYRPEAERLIIREVVLKVVLNDVIPKISQPWFIHKLILDALEQSEPQITRSPTSRSPSPPSLSMHNVIVAVLSAIQSISGGCLALIEVYKQARTTIQLVNYSDPSLQLKSQDNLLYPILLMISEIFMVTERFAASSIFAILLMLSSMICHFQNRLLRYLLMNFLSTTFLLKTVRTAKKTMFPNGYPAPPPVEPTLEEQAAMRARILAWRGAGPALHILPIMLGPKTSVTLATTLDPLSSAPCNVHLIVSILDVVVASMFPELIS